MHSGQFGAGVLGVCKGFGVEIQGNTVDDINLHYLKGPKLWELWYIPYYG